MTCCDVTVVPILLQALGYDYTIALVQSCSIQQKFNSNLVTLCLWYFGSGYVGFMVPWE